MGASLACCAAETACCATCSMLKCCCCNSVAKGSGKQGGGISNRCANSIYLLIMVLMTILAICLQHFGAPNFDIYSFNIGCQSISRLDTGACKGDGAVYRVSMGLFLWFLFTTAGTLCGKRPFHVS